MVFLRCFCESWCLTAESISRLQNWHNKRIREMCRVTMCQSFVHQVSSARLQKRTGVFSIENYLASRTLLWHLKYFGLVDDGGKAISFSEWATLAQDPAGWLKLVTKAPFHIGKLQLRPPRYDTRKTPKEKRPGAACPRD